MAKKWKIHLVPHTHWDKEWYFTKSTSNVFLTKNINKIYDYFKNQPEKMYKYVFDSQFSIVDDYCDINKNSEHKIREMVAADKFVVSPWYTQTDTYNVTGESIVRNMLTGVKESEKFGNHMKVAYMPDSFGFNANLPQIFNSFDMKGFIHWRGVKSDQIKDGILNQWKGIDGSEILEYNLFKYGYTCGGNFLYDLFHDGYNKEEFKENAKKLYHEIMNDKREILNYVKTASKNTNNNILFPFGSDQMTFFENLTDIIEEINHLDQEHEWIITSYEEYIDLIKNEIDTKNLNTLTGELRYGEFSRVHKTINSGRWDIKSKIKYLEYLIYNVVEPLNVVISQLGGQYNTDLIDKSLRLLFECQAHDSAGGCNTDDTNNSVVERLKTAIDLMETLITMLQRQVAYKKNLEKNEVLIFNPQLTAVNKNIKMRIFTEKQGFEIFDKNGKKLDYRLISQTLINPDNFEIKEEVQTLDLTNFNNVVFWSDIEVEGVPMAKLSFEKLKITELNQKPSYEAIKKTFIENDFFKLSFEDNKINLLDKKTNKTTNEVFKIESDFDGGDSYDFSPKAYDQKPTNELINLDVQVICSNKIETMQIDYNFSVPADLTDQQKVEQPVSLKLKLNEEFIDVEFSLINKAKDVRWRFILDTSISSKVAFSDTSFGVIERGYDYSQELKTWKQDNWNDYPTDIESLESAVWLEEDNKKTGVFVSGSNEYQITGEQKNKIAITLFRAYSLIGRKDLLFRPGRASGIEQYPHETPNANLTNKEIVINLRTAFNSSKNFVKEAKVWCIPDVYYQNQTLNKFYAKGQMFVLPTETISSFEYGQTLIDLPEIDENLVVSTLKHKYDDKKIVIRVYNPTNKVVQITSLKEFNHLNLKEESIAKKTALHPNEFLTIEINKNS